MQVRPGRELLVGSTCFCSRRREKERSNASRRRRLQVVRRRPAPSQRVGAGRYTLEQSLLRASGLYQ